MTTLKRCIEFLDNNDIPYAHTRHANAYRARDVAAAEHLPPCRLAKTVIFSSDAGYGMAVLPADCHSGSGRSRTTPETEACPFGH